MKIYKICLFIFVGVFSTFLIGCSAGKNSSSNDMEFKINKDFFIENARLNNSNKMPRLILDTSRFKDNSIDEFIRLALNLGYRAFEISSNEAKIGYSIKQAINDKIVSRDELFIIEKINPTETNFSELDIKDKCKKIGLDYIDLILFDYSQFTIENYKTLMDSIYAGDIQSIGISNCYTDEDFEGVVSILENSNHPLPILIPVVVQNEDNPFHQNLGFQNFLQDFRVILESTDPFGKDIQTILTDETISQIASRRLKTPRQIIIRWLLQEGRAINLSLYDRDSIIECFDVHDFRLTPEEMFAIRELNKNGL